MMNRRLWILAVLVLMSLAAPGATAQEATPSDDFVTPDPAECQVAPRSVDELVAFLATPAAVTAATPSAAPAGEPADAGTVAAVTATARELYACYNANAFLRVYALYTDAFLASELARANINPDALSLFATPIAPQAADERISIAVHDVEALPDGRVSALVVSRDPLGGDTELSTTYVFAEVDGRWLVDGMSSDPASAG